MINNGLTTQIFYSQILPYDWDDESIPEKINNISFDDANNYYGIESKFSEESDEYS
jgi:hypothetical protein